MIGVFQNENCPQSRLDGSLQPSVPLCATSTVFYIFHILVSGMFGRDGYSCGLGLPKRIFRKHQLVWK